MLPLLETEVAGEDPPSLEDLNVEAPDDPAFEFLEGVELDELELELEVEVEPELELSKVERVPLVGIWVDVAVYVIFTKLGPRQVVLVMC